MPPRHSSRPPLAGVGLLALIPTTLAALGLATGRGHLPPLEALEPLALGVLGGLLSGSGFLLGYALGWLLRPRLPPPPAHPVPVRMDLSRMSTEQLYLELERMNREALLSRQTRRALSPWLRVESEK